jgi:hypothetical protein
MKTRGTTRVFLDTKHERRPARTGCTTSCQSVDDTLGGHSTKLLTRHGQAKQSACLALEISYPIDLRLEIEDWRLGAKSSGDSKSLSEDSRIKRAYLGA